MGSHIAPYIARRLSLFRDIDFHRLSDADEITNQSQQDLNHESSYLSKPVPL